MQKYDITEEEYAAYRPLYFAQLDEEDGEVTDIIGEFIDKIVARTGYDRYSLIQHLVEHTIHNAQ